MLDYFQVCCKVIALNIYKLLFFFRFFAYLFVLICFSCVRLFVTPWTVAHQAHLSMGFSRHKYWSGLPGPPPGDLPDPGIEPSFLMSPALAGGFFTISASWEAPKTIDWC